MTDSAKYRMVKLGDVCEVVSGATPKTSVGEYWKGDIAWTTPADLSKLSGKYLENTPRKLTQLGFDSCATNMLPAHSVLLSSRAPIGLVAINTIPVCTNQGFKSLIPDASVDAGYLYYWLKSETKRLQSLGTGATFKELSKKTVERIEIPLFPMEYQKRVVRILDRADAIRAKRRQLLADYDELRANIFYDVFGVPSRWADSWSRTTIGALTESVQYGTSARAGTDGAWPILRMGNITDDGRLDLTDLKYIDLPKTDIPKYTVRAGDMLFNRTNSKEKVGKSCVVDTDQKLALAGYLVRVRFRNPMHAPFVSAFLNSTYGVKLRQRMAKAAVNQANINATEMKSIEVPSPSDVALREFARRVEAIAAARAKVERALALDDELFASLQSRAFRGAL